MKKIWDLVVFILSSITLLISLRLFWNMGIYVDKYNTTPSLILGSDFWLCMDWIRLGLLAIIVIISGINLFNKMKKRLRT
jgi:hypothetical protein